MIAGTIALEDLTISFTLSNDVVNYTVVDCTGRCEAVCAPNEAFFKALAIAVHMDGMPDYAKDYEDATKAMPCDSILRWIP